MLIEQEKVPPDDAHPPLLIGFALTTSSVRPFLLTSASSPGYSTTTILDPYKSTDLITLDIAMFDVYSQPFIIPLEDTATEDASGSEILRSFVKVFVNVFVHDPSGQGQTSITVSGWILPGLLW